MIPVIDFKSETLLEEIRKAYTTVGFAVFINTLSNKNQTTMNVWFALMKEFFKQDLKRFHSKGGGRESTQRFSYLLTFAHFPT